MKANLVKNVISDSKLLI